MVSTENNLGSVTNPRMKLPYDAAASREYCLQIGLKWMGDESAPLVNAMIAAHDYQFTQAQFDAAMRQHLWHTKQLFTPRNYGWKGRVIMAMFFLFGREPK